MSAAFLPLLIFLKLHVLCQHRRLRVVLINTCPALDVLTLDVSLIIVLVSVIILRRWVVEVELFGT
jgi:hypothetical protein